MNNLEICYVITVWVASTRLLLEASIMINNYSAQIVLPHLSTNLIQNSLKPEYHYLTLKILIACHFYILIYDKFNIDQNHNSYLVSLCFSFSIRDDIFCNLELENLLYSSCYTSVPVFAFEGCLVIS